jgi:hypothetical protein
MSRSTTTRVLACGLLVACGQSRVEHTTHSDDGTTGSAGAGSGETSGASAGAGGPSSGGAGANGGFAGSAGFNVLTGEPAACVTSEGADGIMVDVFPLPEGPHVECHAVNQPGGLDPDCPSDDLYECSIEDCYVRATLPGCCRPDGYCGLLDTGVFLGEKRLGCIDKGPWIENPEILRRDVVPVRCD